MRRASDFPSLDRDLRGILNKHKLLPLLEYSPLPKNNTVHIVCVYIQHTVVYIYLFIYMQSKVEN